MFRSSSTIQNGGAISNGFEILKCLFFLSCYPILIKLTSKCMICQKLSSQILSSPTLSLIIFSSYRPEYKHRVINGQYVKVIIIIIIINIIIIIIIIIYLFIFAVYIFVADDTAAATAVARPDLIKRSTPFITD